MKTNRVLRMAAVGVLWLSLSAGCRKDAPELCKNGECCWPNKTNQFTKRLEGRRAGLLGSAVIFQDTLWSNSYSISICPIQFEQIKTMKLDDNLKDNVVYNPNGTLRLIDSTRAYPYMVWGTVYLVSGFDNSLAPVLGFHLDKAEKIP